jgi:hypothetical protein
MDQLLARLSNLSYEFFGIFLPGVVGWLFLALWWACLGPVGSTMSGGAIPGFTVAGICCALDSLSLAAMTAAAVPAIASIYFLGHLLHWSARSGKPPKADAPPPNRVWRSLCFRIPKPKDSFSPKLGPLFEFVQDEFACGAARIEWPQLFPVLKTYLSRNLTHSLVPTYQNKYTLHRAITTASAAWFWLSIGTLPAVIVLKCVGGPGAHYIALTGCVGAAFLLVRGFSDSYMYHWVNFGNAVVTETYALLRKASDAEFN